MYYETMISHARALAQGKKIARFPPRNPLFEGPKFQHEDYGV
ncbi:MAG: hypothetical protein Q7K54_04670 [Candidatus Parcubacteria bacterium]|nr:hypothetical protein [Candidatus Parcubacteria bacterium]